MSAVRIAAVALLGVWHRDAAVQDVPPAAAVSPVSFARQIAPLLTARCAGCHQPAKAGGKVLLTRHAELLSSGDPDEPLLVPGAPEQSALLAVLLPREEKPPRMPKGAAPLAATEVELLRRWIAEGARDDSPAAAATTFTMEQPPVYAQQPVVTALDFAPDGATLAVSGYHEVLLYSIEPAGRGATLAARLVGLSERIETATFSPDGARLLVVGGSPGRFGEVQLWDVAQRKLERSLPLGRDTLYGGSWSPDGKLVAFGGGDHSVRALDVATGELVFFNAASEDLALDTAFSIDGSHLVSAGRDRALKLFQVATQQFLDNVTSITPGALKGGLQAVDRHPREDALLIGGADGTPKTYKMHRTQKREIGDDFNKLKGYAPLAGRLFAAEYAQDGARFVVGASAAGKGEVRVYALENEAPTWSLPLPTAIYAATWRPDGALLAAGGFDGTVHLLDAANGNLLARFPAAPLQP